MDSLKSILQLAEFDKITTDLEKIIAKLSKRRKDKKISRKVLYELINKKYKTDIPIKNYKPKEKQYWLFTEQHEQIVRMLVKIIIKKLNIPEDKITKIDFPFPKNIKNKD